jgi:hypothetical protein
MMLDEIAARAQRMGTKGADLRTAILDVEDRLGRTLTASEHHAFMTGWQASRAERSEKQCARDQAAADSLRAGTKGR